ncbi:PD-(D/E)XK nuclease family protein, partial [Ruficoccus amylovorans]
MIRPADPDHRPPADIVAFPLRPSDGALAHVSPSAIRDYLQCSLRFYFKRVLGLPEPGSVSLHLGKAVHAGIQAYWIARWRGGDASADVVINHYKTAFDAHEQEAPVPFAEGEREATLAKGEALLRAYCESEHAQNEARPLGVEVKLQDDFPELPSPLLGYVDLVLSAANGPVVCDFKTVAATPNVELEAFLHEGQLCAYQLLIEEATGQPVSARELVFLVKTKTPKVIVHRLPPADETARERFWSMAQAMVDGVYHERWHPQPGMHCGW